MSLNFLALLPLAAPAEAGAASTMPMLISMAVIFAVFYFMMIRPQKKREKQTQAMREKIDVGDEIVTIGGIMGIVVSKKDNFLVIETGSDRSKIRIQKWAIQANITETPTAATPEPEKK